MNAAFDATLLSRIEDAGLNASAPPPQLWLDGWLVRLSPGKARRARCINAVAAGRLSVEEKLARCRTLYESAGLTLHVRVTPFSQPAVLDATLAALGMIAHEETRVMVRAHHDPSDPPPRGPGRIEPIGHHAFAALIGRFRGSTLAERRAHGDRLERAPVPFQAYVWVDDEGRRLACGQVAIESEFAGLYDVYTDAAVRGQGHARALCRSLLGIARQQGASIAYLQVDSGNAAARKVYGALGFTDAYAYHYRSSVRDAG